LKLVIAGGGTGGHLFPALALAEEFKEREPGMEIVFIGAYGGLEEKVVPEYGYSLKLLSVEGVKRKRGLARAAALFKAFKATIAALRMLRKLSPDGVIGSGAYSSAPVVFAARLLGIKTAVLEQNALPGLTNRVSGKVVDRIYIAFEEAFKYFPRSRTKLTGNPIRRAILERAESSVAGGNGPKDKFKVLVFGGSQGATAINAAFLDSAEYLTDVWNGLEVIHQSGEKGYEAVATSYRRKKLKVEVHKFIEDMASAYSGADLVVCRAGATSIAEITAFGLASVLVPYPFASDNHQEVNAESLQAAGASVMIRQDNLTGKTLADTIRSFYEDAGRLKEYSARAAALGRPRAAMVIADDFTKLLGH
jgi:UDP-N-acetylglucosamine--N-acetylmuramyl-(pentapeptide) pyrophosphoryl-undecaprenol N-acetylglucosamine transferase